MTVNWDTGACVALAGVHAHRVGVGDFHFSKQDTGTVTRGSKIVPQSSSLERDRSCSLELLWVWCYTAGGPGFTGQALG